MKNHALTWMMISLALTGVFSMLLVPAEVLMLGDISPLVARILVTIQSAMLAVVFAVVGSFLAPRVGLNAPIISGWLAGGAVGRDVKTIVAAGALMAIPAAIVLVVYSMMSQDYFAALSPDVSAMMKALDPPLITKVLYGGVTEEIIVRWGIMSLIVWIAWRLAGKPETVAAVHVWIGIGLAALIFAVLHLPLLFAFDAAPPQWIIAAVIGGNSIVGVMFGWLFWKYGIEAAIMGHGTTHVLAAGVLGLLHMT
jgi:Type II CAAX prenyl endopeptidase Rce1-like